MDTTNSFAEVLRELGIHALDRYALKRFEMATLCSKHWDDAKLFEHEASQVEKSLEKMGKSNIPAAMNQMIMSAVRGDPDEWRYHLARASKKKRGAMEPGSGDIRSDMQRIGREREEDPVYLRLKVRAIHFGDKKSVEYAAECAGVSVHQAREWCDD